jgi:hypothetical protein
MAPFFDLVWLTSWETQSLFQLTGNQAKKTYWKKKNNFIRIQYRRYLEWKNATF